MFLHMVDNDALRLDSLIILEHIQNQPGALQLIFEMRCVNQNKLVMARGEFHMFFQHRNLVPAVFVQADLANAENGGTIEELGNE